MASVEQVAFDEARRASTQQLGVLEGLRTRATIVLAAAALTLGLAKDSGIDGARIAGFVVFAVIGVLTVWILWPRPMRFESDITSALSGPGVATDPNPVYADWALGLHTNWSANAATIEWLTNLFAASCVLLMAEVLVTLVRIR